MIQPAKSNSHLYVVLARNAAIRTGDPICEANESRTGFDASSSSSSSSSLPTTVREPQRVVGRSRAPLSLEGSAFYYPSNNQHSSGTPGISIFTNQTSQPTYLLTPRTNDASIAVTYDTPGLLETPAEGDY